ncbi:MAG: hypothetical protein AAF449_03685 [Myxococcota bacterium]
MAKDIDRPIAEALTSIERPSPHTRLVAWAEGTLSPSERTRLEEESYQNPDLAAALDLLRPDDDAVHDRMVADALMSLINEKSAATAPTDEQKEAKAGALIPFAARRRQAIGVLALAASLAAIAIVARILGPVPNPVARPPVLVSPLPARPVKATEILDLQIRTDNRTPPSLTAKVDGEDVPVVIPWGKNGDIWRAAAPAYRLTAGQIGLTKLTIKTKPSADHEAALILSLQVELPPYEVHQVVAMAPSTRSAAPSNNTLKLTSQTTKVRIVLIPEVRVRSRTVACLFEQIDSTVNALATTCQHSTDGQVIIELEDKATLLRLKEASALIIVVGPSSADTKASTLIKAARRAVTSGDAGWQVHRIAVE